MTTRDLVEIAKQYVRQSRLNPATKIFQALRIYVNRELENLEAVLDRLEEIVRPGGRVAIITFHSLEDRIVKNKFREREKKGTATSMTKKPIEASEEERERNPRSRSAKLRVITIT